MNSIFTIGHSTGSIDEFIVRLKTHAVEVVADVRSSPHSGRFPHFSQQPLIQSLRSVGIKYVFLGRELGARRNEPECYVGDLADYEKIADLPLFQNGLKRILEGSNKYRIALMCAEHDPLTCHRTILVCRHLKNSRPNIFHILRDSTVESHGQSESRLAAEERQTIDQTDMFDPTSVEVALTTAYRRRGMRIAYQREAHDDEDLHHRVY